MKKSNGKKNKKSRSRKGFWGRNPQARLLNKKPVNVSQKLQTMGPGSTFLSVNDFWTATSGTAKRDVLNVALTGEEFSSRKINYQYFRVIGLRLTVFPSGSTAVSFLHLNFKFGVENVLSSDNIMADDSSKTVASYITRPVTFRFMPPNVTFYKMETVPDFGIMTRPYNLSEWLLTAYNIVPVSALNVYVSGTASYQIQTEMLIQFRGSTFDASITKLNALIAKISLEDRNKAVEAFSSIIKNLKDDGGQQRTQLGAAEPSSIIESEEEEEKEEEVLRGDRRKGVFRGDAKMKKNHF